MFTLHVDGHLVLLLGTFLGAVVTSFSGFAFSPVAGIMMIGAVAPQQLVPLLMLCSALIQLAIAVHSHRALALHVSGSMLLGGAVGLPLALLLLRHLDAVAFQIGFGLFLAFYAVLMLVRPVRGSGQRRGRIPEAAIGLAGGFLGGLTAMPGMLPVLYADLCGLGKDAQRAMVQPFILSMQLLALAMLAATGGIDRTTLGLAANALPTLVAGTVLGLLLFRRVPDAGFRRAVLVTLLVTGAGTALSHIT
jgi:uncharacterized membrane protein YfcA